MARKIRNVRTSRNLREGQTNLKSEEKQRHQYIAPRVLEELENENTVCMLGAYPVYIHSHKANYLEGRDTARGILDKQLNAIVDQAKKQIQTLIPMLRTRADDIAKAALGNKATWLQFAKWWADNPELTKTATEDKNAFYYICLLEKIKQQATLIGNFLYTKKNGRTAAKSKRSKNNKPAEVLTDGALKILYDLDLVDATYQGLKDEHAQGRIQDIRKSQRRDMAELNMKLLQELGPTKSPTSDDVNNAQKLIKAAQLDLAKGGSFKTNKNNEIDENSAIGQVDYSFATSIGRIFEYILGKVTEIGRKEATISVENIAAELTGENAKNKKADASVKLMTEAGKTVQFSVSMKSGMALDYDAIEKKEGSPTTYAFIDQFTAGLSSSTLSITDVGTVLNLNDLGEGVVDIQETQGLFKYILANAAQFRNADTYDKNTIMAFFSWVKVISEIVGTPQEDYVPVVMFFNRIYRSADILSIFQNIAPLDILKYINKSYLASFYKVSARPFKPLTLQIAKNQAIDEIVKNKETVSYGTLKVMLTKLLKTVSESATLNPQFSTSFRILMNNKNILQLSKEVKKE